MNTLQIPKGYVLVPEATYQRFLKGIEWQDIEAPTISDVAEYTGVSKDKIKKDLKKYNCPLRVFEKGQKGRGAETKFLKQSVEEYRNWIK